VLLELDNAASGPKNIMKTPNGAYPYHHFNEYVQLCVILFQIVGKISTENSQWNPGTGEDENAANEGAPRV
jgi:hypothetical protein